MGQWEWEHGDMLAAWDVGELSAGPRLWLSDAGVGVAVAAVVSCSMRARSSWVLEIMLWLQLPVVRCC